MKCFSNFFFSFRVSALHLIIWKWKEMLKRFFMVFTDTPIFFFRTLLLMNFFLWFFIFLHSVKNYSQSPFVYFFNRKSFKKYRNYKSWLFEVVHLKVKNLLNNLRGSHNVIFYPVRSHQPVKFWINIDQIKIWSVELKIDLFVQSKKTPYTPEHSFISKHTIDFNETTLFNYRPKMISKSSLPAMLSSISSKNLFMNHLFIKAFFWVILESVRNSSKFPLVLRTKI